MLGHGCHDTKKQTYELKMTNLFDLTARELEILQLVIAGYANKAIANELHISKKTVEFHLDHIYTKIGVRTRLMAGIWAIQHGIGREARVMSS
jgi:DNA-binding NarL/FixJ family response regulator